MSNFNKSLRELKKMTMIILIAFILSIFLGLVLAGFMGEGFVQTSGDLGRQTTHALVNNLYSYYFVTLFLILLAYFVILNHWRMKTYLNRLRESIKANSIAIELILLSQLLIAIKASDFISPGLKIIPGLVAFILFFLGVTVIELPKQEMARVVSAILIAMAVAMIIAFYLVGVF